MNYHGSCTYVALGMLLSYYDVFLNDDIIPEQYDVVSSGQTTDIYSRFDSPGILKDVITNPDNPQNGFYGRDLTAEEYLDKIIEMSNQSLHSKLISIGYTLGFYNMDNPSNSYCGASIAEIGNVLKNYLTEYLDYSDASFEIVYDGSSTDEELMDFIISSIQEGYPVLLSVYGDGDTGHTIVAYDYDEDTNSIYCHMGHNANSTHVTPESEGYYLYGEAFIINWNIPHKHSNNYVVVSNETNAVTYYCYDDPSLSILSHTCFYNDSYENNSSNNHRAICKCGNLIQVY